MRRRDGDIGSTGSAAVKAANDSLGVDGDDEAELMGCCCEYCCCEFGWCNCCVCSKEKQAGREARFLVRFDFVVIVEAAVVMRTSSSESLTMGGVVLGTLRDTGSDFWIDGLFVPDGRRAYERRLERVKSSSVTMVTEERDLEGEDNEESSSSSSSDEETE